MITCLPFHVVLNDPLEVGVIGAVLGCLLTLWLSHATRRHS